MKHEGDGLVLESAFKYTGTIDSGFYYEVSGDDRVALKLSVERMSDGNYYFSANDQYTGVACVTGTIYGIKAEFTTSQKEVKLWINGVSAGTYEYKEQSTLISEIKIGTTEEQVATVNLNFVYVYVNYTVNETFMAASVGTSPAWWDEASGSIATAQGSPYAC